MITRGEYFLEKKKYTLLVMTLIFIIALILGAVIGTKYQQTLSAKQALAVAQENAKQEQEDLDYLQGELKTIKTDGLSSIVAMNKEIINIKSLNLDHDTKLKVANEIIKLNNITKKRDELKKPTFASEKTYNLYIDIKDLYSAIDRYVKDYTYAIDNKSNDDLNKATKELENIKALLDKNDQTK